MPKVRGLGRGLSELIPEEVLKPEDRPEEVPLARIHPNAQQPRRHFDGQALEELARSIAEHGMLQPIVVRAIADGWEIVAGERRFRAAALAGLERVPVVVREVADERMLEIALIENLQREDLTVWEEASAIRALMQRWKWTQEEVAQRLGRSRSHVANILRVLALPEDVRPLVEEGRLTLGQVKALLEAPQEAWGELAHRAADEGWSVRQIERAVAERGRRAANQKTTPEVLSEPEQSLRSWAERAGAVLGQAVTWRARARGGEIVIRCTDVEAAKEVFQRLAGGAVQRGEGAGGP